MNSANYKQLLMLSVSKFLVLGTIASMPVSVYAADSQKLGDGGNATKTGDTITIDVIDATQGTTGPAITQKAGNQINLNLNDKNFTIGDDASKKIAIDVTHPDVIVQLIDDGGNNNKALTISADTTFVNVGTGGSLESVAIGDATNKVAGVTMTANKAKLIVISGSAAAGTPDISLLNTGIIDCTGNATGRVVEAADKTLLDGTTVTINNGGITLATQGLGFDFKNGNHAAITHTAGDITFAGDNASNTVFSFGDEGVFTIEGKAKIDAGTGKIFDTVSSKVTATVKAKAEWIGALNLGTHNESSVTVEDGATFKNTQVTFGAADQRLKVGAIIGATLDKAIDSNIKNGGILELTANTTLNANIGSTNPLKTIIVPESKTITFKNANNRVFAAEKVTLTNSSTLVFDANDNDSVGKLAFAIEPTAKGAGTVQITAALTGDKTVSSPGNFGTADLPISQLEVLNNTAGQDLTLQLEHNVYSQNPLKLNTGNTGSSILAINKSNLVISNNIITAGTNKGVVSIENNVTYKSTTAMGSSDAALSLVAIGVGSVLQAENAIYSQSVLFTHTGSKLEINKDDLTIDSPIAGNGGNEGIIVLNANHTFKDLSGATVGTLKVAKGRAKFDAGTANIKLHNVTLESKDAIVDFSGADHTIAGGGTLTITGGTLDTGADKTTITGYTFNANNSGTLAVTVSDIDTKTAGKFVTAKAFDFSNFAFVITSTKERAQFKNAVEDIEIFDTGINGGVLNLNKAKVFGNNLVDSFTLTTDVSAQKVLATSSRNVAGLALYLAQHASKYGNVLSGDLAVAIAQDYINNLGDDARVAHLNQYLKVDANTDIAALISKVNVDFNPNTDVSGVKHAVLGNTMNMVTAVFLNDMNARAAALAAGDGWSKPAVWFQPHAGMGRSDERTNSAGATFLGYRSKFFGGSLGVTLYHNTSGEHCGIGFSYNHTQASESHGKLNDLKAHGFMLNLYGTLRPYENMFVNMVLGGGFSSFDNRRIIASGSKFKGSSSGYQFVAQAVAGYDFKRQGLVMSPGVFVAFAHNNVGGYTEKVSALVTPTDANQALRVASQGRSLGRIGLQASVAGNADLGNGCQLSPQLTLRLTRLLGDLSHKVKVNNLGGAGAPYQIVTPKAGVAMFEAQGSLVFSKDAWNVSTSYLIQSGAHYVNHNVTLKFERLI